MRVGRPVLREGSGAEEVSGGRASVDEERFGRLVGEDDCWVGERFDDESVLAVSVFCV